MAKGLVTPTPSFESTGNRARSAAGGGLGGNPVNYNVAKQPTDTSFTDMGKAFGAIARAAETITFERDAVKAVAVENREVIAAQKAIDELNPLDADYADRVKQTWADAGRRAKEGSGITSSEVSADLEKRMERHGMAGELSGQRIRKAAVSDEGVRQYKNSMEIVNAKIRSDPAGRDLYMQEFANDAARLKVAIDPTKQGGLDDWAKEQSVIAQITGYNEKGNFAGARAALKDQSGALSNGAANTLGNQTDAKESKARADGDRWRGNMLAGVLVDIDDKANGNKPWVGDERAKLDELKSKGVLGPREYLSAVTSLNNGLHAQKVNDAKNAKAVEELNNGAAFTTQDNVNRAFQQMLPEAQKLSALANRADPATWEKASNMALTFLDKANVAPDPVKDFIAAADRKDNKEDALYVARATQLYDKLEEANPRNAAGINLQKTGTIAIVRGEAKRLIEQGVQPADAYAQAAQTQMGKGPLTIQQEKDREDVAKKALSKMDIPAKVQSLFDPGFLSRNPSGDSAMQGDYARTYEELARKFTDPAALDAAVATEMKRKYGPSGVGQVSTQEVIIDGQKQAQSPSVDRRDLTMYPIEKYGRVASGTKYLSDDQYSAVLSHDVERGLNALGIKPTRSAEFPNLAPYKLQAVDQTVADIRAGRAPRYQVQVLKGDHYEIVPGLPPYVPPNDEQLRANPVYERYNSEKVQKDVQQRQDYLNNQTEIHERNEQNRAPTGKPSQVPQPLVDKPRRK